MVTTTGIVLSDPATQSPLVLDASSYVTNTTTPNSGDAIVSTVTGDWSITNYGRIVATRSDGDGIDLSFGGTSTVINFGTVTASGTYGIGILIDQGTVYNRTGGVISALGGAATGRGVEVSRYGAASSIPARFRLSLISASASSWSTTARSSTGPPARPPH